MVYFLYWPEVKNMENMGVLINKLRTEKGMTLEELGNKVGVGKSTVRKWENGIIANMRRDKIAKVADALDVSPAYLMGWESNLDTSGNFIANIMQDTEFLEYAKIFYALPREQKVKVYGYIDALKKDRD